MSNITIEEINSLQNKKQISELTPRVYVACLAAYNAGYLHGSWIDATQGYDEVMEEIHAMLAASEAEGAEEWEVHDIDNFHGIEADRLGLEKLCELAEKIQEYDDDNSSQIDGAVFAQLYNDYGLDGAISKIDDEYIGCYESENAFIWDYVEQIGLFEGSSEMMQRYFDYDSFLHDLECNCEILCIRVSYKEYHYFHNA